MIEDGFEVAEKQLKGFASSKVRTKLLLNLMGGGKNTGILEKELGIRGTTILHSIKDMTENDLIKKSSSGEYSLTNIGMIQASILSDMVSSIVVIEQHRDFWLNHDISGIPKELQKRIGMLGRSQIITSDVESPLKSLEYFTTELAKSRDIHGVSPLIAPGFTELMTSLINNGANVELVLTARVLSMILEDHYNTINEFLSRYELFKLYIISDDLKVAFTVTDRFLSLGLYRLDGTYDAGNDLICIGKDAIAWGFDLFEYYKTCAVKITPDSLGQYYDIE